MQKVLMRWQAATLSGWGLLGLNLFEHWAAGPDIQPLMGLPLALRDFPGVSPLRYAAMRPAMEAMARGVPLIVSNNTGTRDLVDSDNCIGLISQDAVTGQPDIGTEGWGESRVEEIVAALETLYTDTQKRRRLGARSAQWILEKNRTWRDHAALLNAHLPTLL